MNLPPIYYPRIARMLHRWANSIDTPVEIHQSEAEIALFEAGRNLGAVLREHERRFAAFGRGLGSASIKR